MANSPHVPTSEATTCGSAGGSSGSSSSLNSGSSANSSQASSSADIYSKLGEGGDKRGPIAATSLPRQEDSTASNISKAPSAAATSSLGRAMWQLLLPPLRERPRPWDPLAASSSSSSSQEAAVAAAIAKSTGSRPVAPVLPASPKEPFTLCVSYTSHPLSLKAKTLGEEPKAQHVTVCLRRDANHIRRVWWNIAEGLYFTKITTAEQAGQLIVESAVPPAPSARPRTIWHQRTDNYEVHLGDKVVETKSQAVRVVEKTFGPPLSLIGQYLSGFVDGTHARVVRYWASTVADGAPLRAGRRMIEVWTKPPEGGSSGGGSSGDDKNSSQPGTS